MVTYRKILNIQQALVAAVDSEPHHQQQVPGRDANALPHARVWDRLEVADQIDIGWGRGAFEHRVEGIPPNSAQACSLDKRTYD